MLHETIRNDVSSATQRCNIAATLFRIVTTFSNIATLCCTTEKLSLLIVLNKKPEEIILCPICKLEYFRAPAMQTRKSMVSGGAPVNFFAVP